MRHQDLSFRPIDERALRREHMARRILVMDRETVKSLGHENRGGDEFSKIVDHADHDVRRLLKMCRP